MIASLWTIVSVLFSLSDGFYLNFLYINTNSYSWFIILRSETLVILSIQSFIFRTFHSISSSVGMFSFYNPFILFIVIIIKAYWQCRFFLRALSLSLSHSLTLSLSLSLCLSLSCFLCLLVTALDKISRWYPVSTQSWWTEVFAWRSM